MKALPNEVGRVVVSRQGHDKGRMFVIVEMPDDRFALIVDGDTRKLANPKKKRIKHLEAKPNVLPEAVDAYRQRRETGNSMIRKALKVLTLPAGNDSIKEEYALVQE